MWIYSILELSIFSLMCCHALKGRAFESKQDKEFSSSTQTNKGSSSNSIANWQRAQARKIFIDLGAYDGMSTRSYLKTMLSNSDVILTDPVISQTGSDGSAYSESFMRPINSTARNATDSQSYSGWEVHMVEANKIWEHSLNTTRDELLLLSGVKSVKIYPGKAIGTFNGVTSLIIDGKEGPGDAGTTLSRDSKSAVGRSVPVDMIDIVSLLRQLRLRAKDFVAIKMDIEGYEFQLLRYMILKGLLRNIDRIAIEWHHESYHVFGMPNEDEKGKPHYEERVQIHLKYKSQYHALMWIVEGSQELASKFTNWG